MIGAVNNSISSVQKQQAYGTFASTSETVQNNISLADLAFKASCTAAVASGAATMLLGIHGNTAAAAYAFAGTGVAATATCALAILDSIKNDQASQVNQTSDNNSVHYDILMKDIHNIV